MSATIKRKVTLEPSSRAAAGFESAKRCRRWNRSEETNIRSDQEPRGHNNNNPVVAAPVLPVPQSITFTTTTRGFLKQKWPILDLILTRASDEIVAKIAKDIRINKILDLRLDYDHVLGGYSYTPASSAGKNFECNVIIPVDLQMAGTHARPWRGMNMEARGWIGCHDVADEPYVMNENKFLFHLMMTMIHDEGFYDKLLTPGVDRPYHIYDKQEKDLMTTWGGDNERFIFEIGNPSLEEVLRVVTRDHDFEVTAQTDGHVLFERRND